MITKHPPGPPMTLDDLRAPKTRLPVLGRHVQAAL
jgi:hypothetical protein